MLLEEGYAKNVYMSANGSVVMMGGKTELWPAQHVIGRGSKRNQKVR